MENSNDTIVNRNRDLPNCSAVAQATLPPRTPIVSSWFWKTQSVMEEALQRLRSQFTELIDSTSFEATTSGKLCGGDAIMPGPSPFYLKGEHGDCFTPRHALAYSLACLERQGSVSGQFIWDLYNTK